MKVSVWLKEMQAESVCEIFETAYTQRCPKYLSVLIVYSLGMALQPTWNNSKAQLQFTIPAPSL